MAQTKAERQAEFRKRRATVDRTELAALFAAIDTAAAAGDPMARTIRTGTADALLRNLSRWFNQRAVELRP